MLQTLGKDAMDTRAREQWCVCSGVSACGVCVTSSSPRRIYFLIPCVQIKIKLLLRRLYKI